MIPKDIEDPPAHRHYWHGGAAAISPADLKALREENARLRGEVERLKAELRAWQACAESMRLPMVMMLRRIEEST